jgi:amicyanin
LLRALPLVLLPWAWGCNTRPETGATETPPAPTGLKIVTINNFKYDPADLEVSPGTTVKWTNLDDMPHTVTSTGEPKSLASPALDSDDTFVFTFSQVGAYDYICTLHPSMKGRVVVK